MTTKVKGWTKKILKVTKGRRSESVADPDEGSFDEATKMVSRLNQPDPEPTIKRGSKIKFFDVSEAHPGGCWMQGLVGQRTTKISVARASKFKTNSYNIENIELIMDFGLSNEEYPEKRSVNLSPGACWTLVTDENPGDIFSLSASDQGLMEVGIEDVPDVRTIEEEKMIEEQHTDGAGAIVQDDNPEETT